jgi:cyclophilin family peptidyl-prolyl cis-trans isomerase
MRLKSLFALLAALLLSSVLFSGALAAQGITTPPPPPALSPENTLLLDLSSGGRVTIQLRPDVAPRHVERIKLLARKGFYDGLKFHRVIEGFMAQAGDPKGDGTGGSDLPDLAAEFNGLPHLRGAVAAARTEQPNTANSQFFIMFAPRFALDGKYTVFGRVVGGMNYVDAITRGEPPAQPTIIVRASIGADNVPPPPPQAMAPVSAPGLVTVLPTRAPSVAPAAGPAIPPAPAPARAKPAPAKAAPKRR